MAMLLFLAYDEYIQKHRKMSKNIEGKKRIAVV